MSGVDDRIVSMKFDNAAFEQKLSQTIDSLDKLRKSLDFANSTKGMQELGAASKNFNMGGMAAAVEGVSAKFAALATVGITALANITNRAVDAGIQFAKSLSLGPVTQGFQEFELKMGSIQTIMAGSGASLEVVNQKLQELNAYSDRTIYSFKDMTSNIGKFTNAGVGLDQAVASIQGVANVAALSGANSEEASRAMYNFSQALSTGSVKLIDWKSIELANMGTVEFKQQLIDSAVAMGTLTKASDGSIRSLEGNEVTTKNFNTTLADAWLTSEALTETLGRYSDTTTDIGQRATIAATQIKTFSQMIDTMKESVGSGWATTFENIFGNFNQGTALWTKINDAFSGFVGKSADERNKMLKAWNDFSARDVFFESLGKALGFIGDILRPIGEAFREIFPKKTAEDLIIWTAKFRDFVDGLKMGEDSTKAIKTAFKAFFAVIDIGWEIIKGVASVFFALVKGVWSLLSPILKLAAGGGGLVTTFHEILVEGGGLAGFFDILTGGIDKAFGAIRVFAGGVINFFKKFAPVLDPAVEAIKSFAGGVVEFFTGLGPIILAPIKALGELTAAIGDFFSSLSFGKKGDDKVSETSKDLEESTSLASKLLSSLKNVFSQIGDFLGGIVDSIAGAFKGLGGAIASALGSGDFNQVLNILKTGLLGGILIYIRKFFREGFKLDLGQGRLFDKVGEMLDVVTSGLKSLQANVRADTLLKIAGAMGILAVSVVALSLVDAAALAKAMAAIAAGFTQLTAVMLILEKSSAGGGSIKIVAMATGMILLAGAMALLVIPIMALSRMDMMELAKGLGAVSIGMIVMATAMKIIGSSSSLTGVVRAGAAMILISVALIVLAKAIKSFAELNLVEMGFGLGQAALGIGLLILALRGMPDDVAKKGLGLLILAFSLRSLAKVVQLFAGIDFGTLAKGFGAIFVGLAAIGIAMSEFPKDMPAKAAGLLLVSAALFIIGKTIEQVGNIPFGELVKGVLGLTVMLGALALAIAVMSESQGGVAGLILAAGGLLIIGKAIQEVGSIPFGELLKGIAGLAAALAVLAVASLVAPGLLILGVALVAIGAGLALVGAGVALAGKGFELLAKFGGEGMNHLAAAMQELIKKAPQFVSAFVEGIILAGVNIGKQMPKLVEVITNVLNAILQAIIDVIPKITELLGALISAGLTLMREKTPEFVATGIAMINAFLTGIRDNIGEFVTLAGEIITGFLDAMTVQVPDIIESLFTLFTTVLTELAFKVGEQATLFIPVGQALIDGLITGLTTNIGNLLNFFIELPGKIIGIIKEALGISSPSTVFQALGGDVILGFLKGLLETVIKVNAFFLELPGKILGWIGDLLKTLVPKGIDIISGFLKGIIDKAVEVMSWYGSLPGKILAAVGNVARTLWDKGIEIIGGLAGGIIERFTGVTDWFGSLGTKIKQWISGAQEWLVETGKDIIRGLWNGMTALKDWIINKAKDLAGSVIDGIKGFFRIDSPSKVFMEIGVNLGEGLGIGLKKMSGYAANSATELGENVKSGWAKASVELAASLANMNEFSPTITPVLDLSKVQAESKNLDQLLSISTIAPDVSYARARTIATTAELTDKANDVPPYTGPSEVKFEQNIYAPRALSTHDIYRNTKSQIALAKEELSIP